MLRANVGLSKKVSRDYQSTGYSINLDGEIPFGTNDAEGVLTKVRELFDLAQEALRREVDRDQGEQAIGGRDEVRPVEAASNHKQPGQATQEDASTNPSSGQSAVAGGRAQAEPATNKQVQFILTVGRRAKLSTKQLESRISEIVGRSCSSVYDLSKKEAGKVLDQFTATAQSA